MGGGCRPHLPERGGYRNETGQKFLSGLTRLGEAEPRAWTAGHVVRWDFYLLG